MHLSCTKIFFAMNNDDKINGCTRRHSRLLSNINHTIKHRFSRHVYEAVLQTEHLLSVTAEDSFKITTIYLLPKRHLTSDSIADFTFHIIEVLHDPALVDEPAKPVRTMTVREMKMIPDEVGVVGLAFLNLSIYIEVCDGHGVGIQSPQRNVFLFQWTVCHLFTFVSAHGYYLHCYAVIVLNSSHHGSHLTYNNRSTPK